MAAHRQSASDTCDLPLTVEPGAHLPRVRQTGDRTGDRMGEGADVQWDAARGTTNAGKSGALTLSLHSRPPLVLLSSPLVSSRLV